MSDVMPYESTKYSALSPEMLSLWVDAFSGALTRAADLKPQVLILHHLWMLTSLAVDFFPESKCIGICHHTDLRQARCNPGLAERYVTNIPKLETILSLSDAHQAEIQALHPCGCDKIVTMGGGFDGTLFYPRGRGRREGPVKILYAGKIDPSKGVFALIKAFSSLRRREPGLSLTIVGTPTREYADQLNELTRGDSGISLHPAMAQPDLAETMREHDIFVLPSFFEGLGLIAIEALACGLWTVATEIEGLVSLLGKRVAQSGAIEFVALPAMKEAGGLSDSHLGGFIDQLAAKLSGQVTRARHESGFPEGIQADIAQHSWAAVAAKINLLIGHE